MAAANVRRFDVWLVRLDPVQGSEIAKTQPCVVISPDELTAFLRTVIIAPLTTASRAYPFRVPCRFRQRDGFVVLDQIRTVDRVRLTRRLGLLAPATQARLLETLAELFAP